MKLSEWIIVIGVAVIFALVIAVGAKHSRIKERCNFSGGIVYKPFLSAPLCLKRKS